MAHEHDDVLAEVQALVGTDAADVAQCYSDDDKQWWVLNANNEVFAYAWYDANDDLNIKDYRP